MMPTWCKWVIGLIGGFIALSIIANILSVFIPDQSRRG